MNHTYNPRLESKKFYAVTLIVRDGRGGEDRDFVMIEMGLDSCPPALDFAAIRAQLNPQGLDVAFAKIGFHDGPGGSRKGLDSYLMRCLDQAGVPFFLKSADYPDLIEKAAKLKWKSGVPHALVYRRSLPPNGVDNWNPDIPNTLATPEKAARDHWDLHRQYFPERLEPYKHLIWLETINEVDKEKGEWYGEFSYRTALMAMEAGFNYAAFGWSTGTPEKVAWTGPWMRQFLELAAANPDRIAVALHEYSLNHDRLDNGYPNLLGRFHERFFKTLDNLNPPIPRPTVLITEFGWGAFDLPHSVAQAMDPNGNIPWAAELYAQHPQVKGAAIWWLGGGFGGINQWAEQLIAPITEYSLQNYFVVPEQQN